VRHEMRSLAGLVLAVPALLLSAACCCKRPPFLIGDTISGGPDGSAFVKVAVTLGKDDNNACAVLDVHPERVYVFPGSAIRWKVNNACDATARLLKFTQPKPAPGRKSATADATRVAAEAVPVPEAWSFANCEPQITLRPKRDPGNVLLCEVPEDARPGLYKYGLAGDIVPYDPGIEVRPGGPK
jgi:hypothetical protein